MTFRKILCPTDFSPGSQAALKMAVRMADRDDAELVIAHAWSIPPTPDGYMFGEAIIGDIEGDARRGLEAAVREADILGAKRITSKLVMGMPTTAITDIAAQDPAFDLIVAGTQGRTGLARVLLGSVAEAIVRHAPCSVLAVHPTHAVAPLRNVVCAVDFSEDSRDAALFAAQLVEPGGKITLLHVLELPIAYFGSREITDVISDLERQSARLLDELAMKVRVVTTVPIATVTRDGRFPGAQILKALEEDSSVDLVVVGSRGRTGIRRALLGSVAEKIVRHAGCPVLVARRRR